MKDGVQHDSSGVPSPSFSAMTAIVDSHFKKKESVKSITYLINFLGARQARARVLDQTVKLE